ncbi:hypothetical protein BDD12DRAFT_87045 [Trichophaea hybrida]|nr:hypothetical protein BDD12DRAFT_87045 [Trichophaea hybrida]
MHRTPPGYIFWECLMFRKPNSCFFCNHPSRIHTFARTFFSSGIILNSTCLCRRESYPPIARARTDEGEVKMIV